jgi:hypothetical protein
MRGSETFGVQRSAFTVLVHGGKETPSAISLHRSQIFKEFVSDAGPGSGTLRLCRTIPLLCG